MNFPLYQHSTMVNLIIECEKIIAAFSFLRVAITSLLMMAFLSLLRVSFKTLCRSRKPFFHVEEISLYSHPTFTPFMKFVFLLEKYILIHPGWFPP